MSYILDALRKAEAERERGHVPNVHAQPGMTSPAPLARAQASHPWPSVLGAAAAGGLLVIAAFAAWTHFGATPAEPGVEAHRSAADLPPKAPPADLAATAAPTAAQTIAPAAPPTATTTASPVAPTAEAPRTPRHARPAPDPLPLPLPLPRPAPRAAPRPLPSTAPSPQPPTATPSAAPLPALNQLPDDLRRQVPALNIGGSVYSSHAPDRLLIINGQVLHEGDTLGGVLTLQQIRVKSAVFALRETRFVVNY